MLRLATDRSIRPLKINQASADTIRKRKNMQLERGTGGGGDQDNRRFVFTLDRGVVASSSRAAPRFLSRFPEFLSEIPSVLYKVVLLFKCIRLYVLVTHFDYCISSFVSIGKIRMGDKLDFREFYHLVHARRKF